MSGRIHAIRYCCPAKHPIWVTGYDVERATFEEACAAANEIFGKILKPQCMLCGSTTLGFDDIETPFDTMEAAMAFLQRLSGRYPEN